MLAVLLVCGEEAAVETGECEMRNGHVDGMEGPLR